LLTTVLLDPTLDKECHSNPEGIAPRSIAARIREKTETLLAENGYDLGLRDNAQGWWLR
jgi:hypothetical protein